MFKYPQNLYCDVRIEKLASTDIVCRRGELEEKRCRLTCGAFVRVFDGNCWRCAAVADLSSVQARIDSLAAQSSPRADINKHPVVEKLSCAHDTRPTPPEQDIRAYPAQQKEKELVSFYKTMFDQKTVAFWTAAYHDRHWRKEFYSSKDAALLWEGQSACVSVSFRLAEKGRAAQGVFTRDFTAPRGLDRYGASLATCVAEYAHHLRHASAAKPGVYPVIFGPMAAGVLAQDCVGSLAGADSLSGGDWRTGKIVGADFLNIIDHGFEEGPAQSCFDDEGTLSAKNWLVKDGVLCSPLHDARTAAAFNSAPTGNARARDIEHEPRLCPTNTWFAPGGDKLDKMIAGVADGFLVKAASGGTVCGNSFSLRPELAYRIEQGKVTSPVIMKALHGEIYETLAGITAVSCEPAQLFRATGVDALNRASGGSHLLVREVTVL